MNQDIVELFVRYLNSQCSAEDLKKVFEILQSGTFQEEWDFALSQDANMQMESNIPLPPGHDLSKIYSHHRLMTAISQEKKFLSLKRSSIIWRRIAVAAVMSSIVFGIWFFNTAHPDAISSSTQSHNLNDVAPGKSGATITLSTGKIIQLDSNKRGLVIGEFLTYDDGTAIPSSEMGSVGTAEMTLIASTAKAETYEFTLPDGSQVRLNSDSKLSFSTALDKMASRNVRLIGEGYFKVAKDKSRPFIVESRGQQVKVLGTAFNINSYADEPDSKTTLIEGSIEISNEKTKSLLQPGQQATLNKQGILTTAEADTEMATAWINDKFIFGDNDIQSVMRVLQRWYNIEVIYSGPLPDLTFGGKISRSNSLSGVLRFLETTGAVHFKIEGHKVYVRK